MSPQDNKEKQYYVLRVLGAFLLLTSHLIFLIHLVDINLLNFTYKIRKFKEEASKHVETIEKYELFVIRSIFNILNTILAKL